MLNVSSSFRDDSFFSELTTYRNEQVLKVVSSLGLEYPRIDSQLMTGYFKGLRQAKVIPKISPVAIGLCKILHTIKLVKLGILNRLQSIS